MQASFMEASSMFNPVSEYYQGCQPGWEKYGDYCYMANVNKMTFEAAQDECAAKGGADLVSIHDAAESAFVETLINEGPECPDDGSGSWYLDSAVGGLYTLDKMNCTVGFVN